MTPDGWIEHRRGDGERVGWMRESGDGFIAIDLLGREVTDAVDWFTAESALDERGIGYLADAYELELSEGVVVAVRIVEVSTTRILVKREDYGDMTAPRIDLEVAWPVPPELRARR